MSQPQKLSVLPGVPVGNRGPSEEKVAEAQRLGEKSRLMAKKAYVGNPHCLYLSCHLSLFILFHSFYFQLCLGIHIGFNGVAPLQCKYLLL